MKPPKFIQIIAPLTGGVFALGDDGTLWMLRSPADTWIPIGWTMIPHESVE